MNVVLIIPTGIGCEIGGHAGDANPVAKLLGACCDKIILHPNVVNASDINEMPENALYVEGSMLDRFLNGEIMLEEVHYNKILLVVNKPVSVNTINSVNAAITTIGADIQIVELDTPLEMNGWITREGKAGGIVHGWDELCNQVSNYDYDAIAIQTPISVSEHDKLTYLEGIGGVNVWGGIEAITSKLISAALNVPVAHSPFEDVANKEDALYNFKKIVDPRMSAEMVSVSYLHCILKGLHKAPRISMRGLSVADVDFLISPINCFGAPHKACVERNIPIIYVKENKNVLEDFMIGKPIIVDNYLEAAGLLMAYKSGINYKSVRRPIN